MLQPLHPLAAFPGLLCLLRKTTRTIPRASPTTPRPKPLIQAKFSDTCSTNTHLKDSAIPASLFASLQSNYRSFNYLRHFSSISSCTLPSLQPPASAGGDHCNELIRKTQRYKSPQHAPTLINAFFGACSCGEPELRRLCRSRFHCQKSSI